MQVYDLWRAVKMSMNFRTKMLMFLLQRKRQDILNTMNIFLAARFIDDFIANFSLNFRVIRLQPIVS